MASDYLIPAKEIEAEISVNKSRFIASVSNSFSVEEARGYIKSIHHRYSDATHHVPAFLIGYGASVTAHSSDDGEPSGTAGRPILAVLQGSNLGDIVVVVTRYYGGINLGTGGLVKAYSAAVKEALQNLPLARKVNTLIISITVDYHWFDQVKLLLEKFEAKIMENQFTDHVKMEVMIEERIYPDIISSLTALTQGAIAIEIIRQSEATIFPI